MEQPDPKATEYCLRTLMQCLSECFGPRKRTMDDIHRLVDQYRQIESTWLQLPKRKPPEDNTEEVVIIEL